MGSKLLMPAFIGLTVVLFACDRVASHDEEEHGAVDTKAAAEAVQKVESDMLAAFKAKDAGRLSSYYASDAVFASPGHDAGEGPDAIRTMLGADMKDPAFSIDFTNKRTDVAASGDLAYTYGTYRVTFTDPATKKPGSGGGTYVTVFRKQGDGSWKAVADLATSGAPPAG